MADVTIRGVTYTGVAKLDLDKSGGGSALYYDTEDADAVAADLAVGKIAYGASGQITGTKQPPSGTISITDNGTVDVTDYASAAVNVSSGSVPYIVLAVAGRHAAATLGGVYTGFEACEPDYFNPESADSTYTCLKAGTYNVQYFYKPGYGSNGSLVNVQLVIRVNGSNVVSVNSTSATGGNGNATITLAAGDTLALLMRNTTNSVNSHAGGMVLTTGA